MKVYQGFIISTVPASPTLLKVATAGQGGKIPKVLEGMFTSHAAVQEIIDHYLASKSDEELTDGKTRKKG